MAWACIDKANNNVVIAVAFDKNLLPIGYRHVIEEISDDRCAKLLQDNSFAQPPTTESKLSTTIEISDYITAYNNSHLNVQYWKWFSDNVLSNNDLIANRYFFVWDWRWPSYAVGSISNSFPLEIFKLFQKAHADKRICVIIDNLNEAPDYDTHFKPLHQLLISQGILPMDIVVWGSVDDESSTSSTVINSKYGYMYGYENMTVDYNSLGNTTHHFIMLARRPRPLRLMMADLILSKGISSYGHISCGCMTFSYEYDTTPFLSDSNRHMFPILLDDHVPNKHVKMFQISDSRITDAAINIVCETSQDQGLCNRSSWSMPFITEKTTKAFLLHQFPLIVSVPTIVNRLRKDGFDMFDDIIDHAYDDEPNPILRIKMVAEQLENLLCISDIAAFRKLHWDRLKYNHDRVKYIINSYPLRCRSLINEWLLQSQQLNI